MTNCNYLIFLILSVFRHGQSSKILLGDDEVVAIREDLFQEIHTKTSLWKAEVPIRFQKATVADVKRQLGTIMPNEEGYVAPIQTQIKFSDINEDIPESFDARTAWPECAGIIGHIRDQSNCGSCWAFGSTEAFNDRYCIATKDYKTLFSPEDTNSCCSGVACGLSQGCNGGQPAGAWHWFTSKGVSSGGDYPNMNDGSSCKPYSFEACAHHSTPPDGMSSCDKIQPYHTLTCSSKCSDTHFDADYKADKHLASKSYLIHGERSMQQALLEKGTISVALEVYEDFELYKTGIYHHVAGSYLGGHAVKLVGWGVDEGTPYWTCINSWNTMWGEGGSFRILRGSNECGIEASGVAGDVQV